MSRLKLVAGILILQGIIELGESLHWWNSQQPVHLGLVSIKVDPSAAAALYASGGFFEITGLRIKDYLYDFYKPLLLGGTTLANVVAYLVYYARIFGLFSLGMACGRYGLHRNLFAKIGLVRRIWTVSAIISLPILAIMFFVHISSGFVHGLSCIFLAFFYMTSMVLLANNKRTVLLVPKLQLGNAVFEAPASPRNGQRTSRSLQDMGSQAGAWEPAKGKSR